VSRGRIARSDSLTRLFRSHPRHTLTPPSKNQSFLAQSCPVTELPFLTPPGLRWGDEYCERLGAISWG